MGEDSHVCLIRATSALLKNVPSVIVKPSRSVTSTLSQTNLEFASLSAFMFNCTFVWRRELEREPKCRLNARDVQATARKQRRKITADMT